MYLRGILFLIVLIIESLIQAPLYAQTSGPSYVKAVYSIPLSLDPIKMNDTASLAVGNFLYDGLLKFSPTLKTEGALAESWSTSKDGKILTFKLRKNIFFHDGSEISASDVEASLQRALSKESTVRKFYDSIKKIRVVDSKTIVIELNFPFPPFLSVLAGATAKVLPKSKINDPHFFDNPIGSGPFVLTKFDRANKEIQLKAFDRYYSGTPKIASMILKEATEEESIKLSKSGLMHDLTSWPLTEENSIFKSGQKISSPVASTWIIGLNTLKKPFNDLKVRQLFKNQIPVEEFRKTFYPDSTKANGYVPHGLTGSNIKVEINTFGFKPPKDKIVVVIPQELARAFEMKAQLEKSMKEKGWNVEFQLMEWNKLMEGYDKKAHQAFLVSMNMDYPDADFLLKNFESDNPDNFSGLKNVKIDQLLKKSRATQDRKLREVYYKEALKLVESSAVTVNLFHPRANYWVSKCVHGFEPNILSDVYIDYTKVTLGADCAAKQVVK